MNHTSVPVPIFTRYLYVKEEVELALLVSILNKSDDSIFWAYELYYSGFKEELFTLICKIYYDFFASLNPTFEAYLLKKQKEFNTNDILVSSIIQDLLFRPFNTDVFFIRVVCSSFEYEDDAESITNTDTFRKQFLHWVETNDYRSIGQWILNVNKNSICQKDIYSICLDCFELTKGKCKLIKDFEMALKTNIIVDKNVVLLAKIMGLFSSKHHLKRGKSIYIGVEAEDIIPYETLCGTNELPHYRILEKAYICGINDLKCLCLFQLKRHKNKDKNKDKHKHNLKEWYWYKWLYCASFSPLWSQRITQFGGIIDHKCQTVEFHDDELLEAFYSAYGLEPDEQKECVQNKSIMTIEDTCDWKWFYATYKKNGLFDIWEEELEEFDNDKLQY